MNGSRNIVLDYYVAVDYALCHNIGINKYEVSEVSLARINTLFVRQEI
jgi:hypothetical protein